jgi:hypothetical protein
VSLHARKVRSHGWRLLALPYVLCLVTGALLTAGTIFTVESIEQVMSDAYRASRASSGGTWVAYHLFGHSFEPLAATTWAIPALLFGGVALLLPLARRRTVAAWRLATQDRKHYREDTEPRVMGSGDAPA